MSGLRGFLICLAPALLAYLMLFLSKFIGETIGVAIFLIIAGSIVSGTCVTLHLHRTMEPKGQASGMKIFVGILVFLGVAAGYLAIALAGCCGLAVALG